MTVVIKHAKPKNRDELKKCIEEKIAAKGIVLSSKELEAIEELFIHSIEDNLTLGEAFAFPSKKLDDIYERGFLLYRSGKYSEAATYFLYITLFDCNDFRSTFALAACYHKMGEYLAAISNYLTCLVLESNNPIPCYHLYECFLKVKEPIFAQGTLLLAYYRAGDVPMYAKLKAKIELELAALIQA